VGLDDERSLREQLAALTAAVERLSASRAAPDLTFNDIANRYAARVSRGHMYGLATFLAEFGDRRVSETNARLLKGD
jgi:hypothetical protein